MLVEISKYSQAGGALLICLIALAALLRNRNGLNLAMVLCAVSGGALILANSYGNEAAFRVTLFALPWLAILASEFRPPLRPWTTVFWSFTVLLTLSAYLVADMGLDFVYAVRSGDLVALKAFELHAPIGSTLIVIGYNGSYPTDLSARYNEVQEEPYRHVGGFTHASENNATISYDQFMSRLLTTQHLSPPQSLQNTMSYYVLAAQQPAAFLAAYNYATLKQYWAFAAQFASSPQWEIVVLTPTADLFRLRVSS
jgi:hypothetical protein